MKTDHSLEELASRIADDEAIDWREVGDHGRGVRELERIVRGFRHVHESSRAAHVSRPHLFEFGHLHVIAKIGSGASGELYRAYDPNLDLLVALKLCKADTPAIAANVLHEAQCLAKVRQANVVSVYGAAEIGGHVGIWMELVRGETLETLLVRDGPFDADDVQSIGIDLCRALEAVHRQGLVHGDIKLQNIMREDGGRIVLLDFGIARHFRRDDTHAFVSGTLRYVAPEVLRGEPASPKSDQYSLGIVLFRLLTGRYPYKSADYDSLRAEHDRHRNPKLGDIAAATPRRLAGAIDRSIAIDEKSRFAGVKEFGARLREGANLRHPFAVAVGAMLLIVCLVAGAVMWRANTNTAAPWQTQLQFYRMNTEGRQPVASGNTLVAGDGLSLDFQSTKPVYLYVLNASGESSAEILFPRPDMQPANPLPADGDHVIPGSIGNKTYRWIIEKGLASDEFIVIAALQPQSQLDDIAIASGRRLGSGNAVADINRSASLVPDENRMIDSSTLTEFLKKEHLDVNAATSFDANLRYWRFVFPHPHGN